MMSKFKSASLNLNLNAFKPSSNTNTSSKQTNQAIVSISVNQPSSISTTSLSSSSSMASSYNNQCGIVKQEMQQPQLKKKRAALENISNSNSSCSGTSSSSTSNVHQVIDKNHAHIAHMKPQLCKGGINGSTTTLDSIDGNNKGEISQTLSFKKSRYVFGSSINQKSTNATTGKSESLLKQKKPPLNTNKSSSKENLTTTVQGQVNSNAKTDLKKHPNVVVNTKVTKTTKTSSEQNQKQQTLPEQNINEPQIKSDEKVEQSDLEHQLATTTISSTTIQQELMVNDQQSIDEDTQDPIACQKELTPDSIDGWEDIDANDEHDEFSASDYVQQIFKYYRQREDKFEIQDYIRNQPHINRQMRLLLVDWMVEVQQQLEFNHEVLYLSVKLLDLYLNQRRIEKEKLQLLGGAAMFIACKFEERMPPIIDDFIYVSDNAYDRKELIKMEIEILKTVKFDIGVPLSYTFLRRYSKCIRADMRFLTLSRYILELSLQDYHFAYIKDSLKACAALYLALKMSVQYEKSLGVVHHEQIENEQQQQIIQQLTVSTANLTSTEWNETLIHYTGSFLSDFIDLIPQMNNLIRTAPQSKYKTIFKKYSHHVFYEVAKIAPLSDNELQSVIGNCHANSIEKKIRK